jgi:SynChlorMet cassette radical SAM/SPASM protein ScmF
VPPLTSFYLYLTNGCNLACRHCWISPKFVDGEPDPGDCLDLELLKKAVREAKPLGLRHAKLTGGEPTLHPQFVEIVDLLTSYELSLDMETNGTLMDLSLARHLATKTNLSFVSVSLDGPTTDIHDSFRGIKGSFDRALIGFKNLVTVGFRPQVIMALHRGNANLVSDVVELALKIGAGSVKFNPVTKSGRGIKMHKDSETLTFTEIIELVHKIRGPLREEYSIPLIINTPLAFYTANELLDQGPDNNCHVRTVLGILGSGEMALCGIGRTVPELCYGNLEENDIREIWLEHPQLIKLRQELDAPYPVICENCIHARNCASYCVAQNYSYTGKMVSPAWFCIEAYERDLFPQSRMRKFLKNINTNG